MLDRYSLVLSAIDNMGEEIVAGMMRSAFVIVEKQFYEQVKRDLVAHSLESIRRYLLAEVASQFSREVAYDAAQYVRALGAASVTIEVEGEPGQIIETKFKKSVEKFEQWVDSQPADSPIVTALLQKYGQKRSGPTSYINRPPQPVWQMLNAKPRKEPWLNKVSARSDISDLLSQHATEIFNQLLMQSKLGQDGTSQGI